MSKKKVLPICKLCEKEKEITFHGEYMQYPIFSCPIHGADERNEWEIWLDKYKDSWKDECEWEKSNSKISCIVGFFCNYFKEHYGHPYIFNYANPIPYKDKDFMMARRILTMFNQDAKEVRIYIKWVFEKRIKKTNYRVTSIGFFASSNLVNEYFQAKAKSKILKRCSKLPEDFIEWCQSNCSEVFERQELETWNDLNGLVTHVKTYGFNGEEWSVVQEAINRKMISDSLEYVKLEG